MSESFEYSKNNISVRNASVKRKKHTELLVALLFILVLACAWAYQTLTDVSILNVGDDLSSTTKILVVLTVIFVPGIGTLFWLCGNFEKEKRGIKSLKANLEGQRKLNIQCFECEAIARKLSITVLAN